MIKIIIPEFIAYESKAIYEFLLLQNDTEFELVIPREATLNSADEELVMFEYLNAAYIGQQLSLIADSFGYHVPTPHKKAPFNFQIQINDMEKLADTLYPIIQGFNYNAVEPDEFLQFQDNACDFINDAFTEDYVCNTWGLLYIANQML
ncbi:MAG: hypothetical protein ABIW38_05920 [Ferruginibacter sp.]